MKGYEQALKLVPYQGSATNFYKYFMHSADHKQELFELIRSCKVDELHCRFNVWRLTLSVFDIGRTPA